MSEKAPSSLRLTVSIIWTLRYGEKFNQKELKLKIEGKGGTKTCPKGLRETGADPMKRRDARSRLLLAESSDLCRALNPNSSPPFVPLASHILLPPAASPVGRKASTARCPRLSVFPISDGSPSSDPPPSAATS
uniref:Uncharacterized protein n=1 Tax=Oryza punctata TaxID=4537 RepID=A0A0E0KLZ3_ORYPU